MSRAPADIVQLKLRFRESLRQQLEDTSARNEASLNSEIVRRLEDSFALEDELGGPDGLAMHRRIAWAVKQAERQTGSRWTDTPVAFWMAIGAIEGALEELQPPYAGADGEMINRLYLAKEQAQQEYDASYEKLKARFPIQTTANALAAFMPDYSFEPQTIADYRYDRIMTDEELSEAVTGMEPADEALVRAHQGKNRAHRMAELAWKFELGALVEKDQEARQRAKDAVRRERRNIIENQLATRI